VASVGFLGLQTFACQQAAKQAAAEGTAKAVQAGYGALFDDPEGVMRLPKGFSYKIISRQGMPMNDGLVVPGKPDGMATFEAKNGKVIIVRNHEMSPDWLEESGFGKENELLGKLSPDQLYDYGKGKAPSLGGTTTVVYNEETGEVEQQFLSLAGTNRNCAGGRTPWNSWLTCEEDTTAAGGDSEKDHGFVFEVPATESPALAQPIPLKAMGRFNHEAVCVDPKTNIVYLTEDRHDGLIYRFLPNTPGKLADGGKLQVLMIKDKKGFDTRNWEDLETEKLPVNQAVAVEWMDIDNVEAPEDDLRVRGFEMGAARFARGEGMWFGEGEMFFACTNGGHIMQGQIFKYTPSPAEGTAEERNQPGQLELFVEPNDSDILRNCDNLTVAPWGDVVTCEDNSSPSIVGITPKGELYKIAENTGFSSEFAGGCFSPSGKTFFVNIQHAGLTLAITGPWQEQQA